MSATVSMWRSRSQLGLSSTLTLRYAISLCCGSGVSGSSEAALMTHVTARSVRLWGLTAGAPLNRRQSVTSLTDESGVTHSFLWTQSEVQPMYANILTIWGDLIVEISPFSPLLHLNVGCWMFLNASPPRVPFLFPHCQCYLSKTTRLGLLNNMLLC